MKGMKKPLALLLALVMAFGLMNVGAWADDEEPVPMEDASAGEIIEETQEAAVVGTPIPARPDVEAPDEVEVEEDADWDDEAVLLDGDDVVEFTPAEGDVSQMSTFPSSLDSGAYKLLADVTVTNYVVIKSGATVELDLNGYQFNATGSIGFALIGNGQLTLTDTGETAGKFACSGLAILLQGANNTAIVNDRVAIETADGVYFGGSDNALTFNGQMTCSTNGIWINSGKTAAPNSNNTITIGNTGLVECASWAIGLWGTDNTLEVSGKVTSSSFTIFTNGQPNNGTNQWWSENITIKVHDGAEIITSDDDAPAMYLPGTGDCTIDGGVITGPMAIHTKTAALTITGGTLTGTGPHVDWVHNSGGSSAGGNAVMVEKSKGYRPESFSISITGGTFISEKSAPVASYSYQQEVDPDKFITGGAFTGPVAMNPALVAEGYTLAASGNVVPSQSETKTPDYAVEWTKSDGGKLYLVTLPDDLTEGTYKLLQDVTKTTLTVVDDEDAEVVLDLGAYNLIRDNNSGNTALSVEGKAKKVTINGTGSLKAKGNALWIEVSGAEIIVNAKLESLNRGVNFYATACDSTTLTLGQTSEIKAGECGVTAFGSNLTVHVYGKIAANTHAALITNGNPNNGSNTTYSENITFNVYEGAYITSNEGAVYLPGSGTFNMTGGYIEGLTGIYDKSSKVNISGGTIRGVGPKVEYQYYGNGWYDFGEALTLDNCGYPNGEPTPVKITGGEFISDNAAAIGSYAYGKANGVDRVPFGEIVKGKTASDAASEATFKGAVPVNAALVEDGYRIAIGENGVGAVVASAFTVTNTAENADDTVTYTVQDTSEGSTSVTVTAMSSVEESTTLNGEDTTVTVSKKIKNISDAIDMVSFLSETMTNASGDSTLEDNTTVMFTMEAKDLSTEEKADGKTTVTTIDLTPKYKIGSDDAKKLENSFIKNPIPITLGGFIGKPVTAVWHILANGAKERVTFEHNKTTGALTFSLASFSGVAIYQGEEDSEGKPIYAYALSLVEDATHYNANEDTDGYKEYKASGDPITYNIMLEANAPSGVTLEAVNFTVNTGGLVIENDAITINGSTSVTRNNGADDNANKVYVAYDNTTGGASKDISISAGTAPTKIGSITFTFPENATNGDKYDVNITDAAVKTRILGTEQTPDVEGATAKIELDPKYTISLYNPEYVKADQASGTTARASAGTYEYTILTGYANGAALPAPSIGAGYKLVGYKVMAQGTGDKIGNWTVTDAVKNAKNPAIATVSRDYDYTVADDNTVTTDALRTALATATLWGDVELEAVYEVQKYDITIQTPEADATHVLAQVGETYDTAGTSYKYDINGVLYNAEGTALTDEAATPAPQKSIPEITKSYYTFDAFVAYAASEDGEGNWAQYEAVCKRTDTPAEGETEASTTYANFPQGKWGDITLNATYIADQYTITLKNPAVDATTKVITTGEDTIVFAKGSTSTPTVTYTVEGYVQGYAYNVADADKVAATLPTDPFLKHYDFQNHYTVTAVTPVGSADGWKTEDDDSTANEVENQVATGNVAAGHFGDVTLKADYKPHEYTATYIPKTADNEAFDSKSPALGEGITYNTTTHKFTYTIESGVNATPAKIFGVPTRAAYTFSGWTITAAEVAFDAATDRSYDTTAAHEDDGKDYGGWTWDVPVNADDLSATHSVPNETPQNVWGDVTLKANWTLNGVLKTFSYKYARTGDLLALFAIKKVAADTGTYTYAAGSGEAQKMFVVSNDYTALFSTEELAKLSLGENDTVVIYGYIGEGKEATATSGKLAVIAYDHNGTGSTDNVVIQYDGDMTRNNAINAGDYGNVTAMIDDPNQYTYSQVSVRSRLEADVHGRGAGGEETTKQFGTIDDVRAIMNKTVGKNLSPDGN